MSLFKLLVQKITVTNAFKMITSQKQDLSFYTITPTQSLFGHQSIKYPLITFTFCKKKYFASVIWFVFIFIIIK